MAEHELPKSPSRNFEKNIFVNQIGYLPHEKKVAVLKSDCKSFKVIDDKSNIVYDGKVSSFGLDKYSEDTVWQADFSSLKECGTYKIITDNGDESLTFNISDNVYDKTLYDTLKALYFLRCGCELKEEHAGKFTHKECHTDNALLWEDNTVSLDVTGGWHDAGDYGRYITPGCCALAHLLYAYKLYPDVLHSLKLNIPESSNGIPDILSECRYELEWMFKMQCEDGGVYHKLTSFQHAPFIMPEEDNNQLYIFPVSSMATADFCAVCALASGIYKVFDEKFSKKLYDASIKAYNWLENNPEFLGIRNPEGCNTGPYFESDDKDNRYWAYCELYALTGEDKFATMIQALMTEEFSLTGLGFASVGGFGSIAYYLADTLNRDEKLLNRIKTAFMSEAELLKSFSDKCGYRVAMTEKDYCWGSNMIVMKQGMTFAIADLILGDNTYYDYCSAQLDYLLGVNATGYSYVSGNGEFSVNYPHLRPAHADGIEECMPGMVSGGPNRKPCPNDMEILGYPEHLPPMKAFIDDVGCYSLNEITIYWNSPTVFTICNILYRNK